MKILFSGDPHLHLGNFQTSKKYLEKLKGLANQLKPDVVLLAGDLFHTHSIIRSEIMNLWVDYLEDATVPHIALVGNHDQVSPGSEVHALAPLRKLMKVVDSPYKLGNALFLPYVHTADEFQAMLQGQDAEILFCHQTFDGAQYENGFYAPDGFPAQIVAGFKLVVCGHIHKEQQFGNIWYPGTPFAHSFNDAGEQKALYLINTAVSSGAYVESRVPLGLPSYYVVALKVSEVLDWLKQVRLSHNVSQNSSNEDHYKLVINGSKAEIHALQDSLEFKELKKGLNLTVSPQYVDVIVRENRISDSISPEEMMKKYINEIMKTDLDRGKLINLSTNLLKGV